MSAYQEARQCLGRALREHEAARQAKAEADARKAAADARYAETEAEVFEAVRILQRFEIDPEARCPQQLTGASA
jgi:hypothetical protein